MTSFLQSCLTALLLSKATYREYLREFNRLRDMFHDFPAELFVSNLIREFSSSEPDMEATRLLLFESLKSNDDFPYGEMTDLKRRVFTRKGDPVIVKLANDIHTLISVIEGEDYSLLRGMISTSRKRTMSLCASGSDTQPATVTHSLAQSNGPNHLNTEMALLRDTLSSVQAEVLLLKQTVYATDRMRAEQVASVSQAVQDIKTDLFGFRDYLEKHSLNFLCASDEHSSRVGKLVERVELVDCRVRKTRTIFRLY